MSPRTKLEFSVGAAQYQGARPYQEDTMDVWRPTPSDDGDLGPVLSVVADGMGGHVSGEVASRTACRGFIDVFQSGYTQTSIDQLLDQALDLSNDAIFEETRKDPSLQGMGCTLVAAYVTQEGVRWVSVGDSALYLYRDHELRRLNEDHSLGALLDRQAEAEIITFEEAQNDPRRRTLRSALIGSQIAARDKCTEPVSVQHDDWIVIATDGLETLPGDDIAHYLETLDSASDPTQVAQSLLKQVAAREMPHQDNTSVIVIRVRDPLETKTRLIKNGNRGETSETPSEAVTQPMSGGMVPDITSGDGPSTGSRKSRLYYLALFICLVAAAVATFLANPSVLRNAEDLFKTSRLAPLFVEGAHGEIGNLDTPNRVALRPSSFE